MFLDNNIFLFMFLSYADNFVKTTIFYETKDCGNIISRNIG